MTRFKKGQSGNLNGRPKGSRNKSSEEIRIQIGDFLNKNIKTIQKDWSKLNVKDRMKFFIDLLPYGISKFRPIGENEFDECRWCRTKEPCPIHDNRKMLDLDKLPTHILELIVEEINKAESEGKDIYKYSDK